MFTPTKFELFPLLPSELRIRIYKHALTIPRTIVIACQRQKIQGTRQYNEVFTSNALVPALIHTSREARFEALKFYTPSFRTDTSPNYTYIHFEQDTIDCSDRVLQYLNSDVRDKVQNMVVHVYDAALFWHFNMETVKQMIALKSLDILASQDMISWSTNRRWVDGLIGDIRLSKEWHPDWVSPRVTIMDQYTKEELAIIPAGRWVDPENNPEDREPQ
ncbi:hypothetical protein E2P81_ATG01808 [Venturia nashicola]|uniref:2EXR domain-containing protein n=1 Tax=Venturia nashicola TaxID=86259 RepID=A0A4Z1PCE9_9PEZI|nr:hypothetical protein E6O75_ATG01855 [Venturia nashicola]TLD35505.1 hypothetical protein E2P81_ATG01808 [Venturia nashicola]